MFGFDMHNWICYQ